ncbi:MAG: polyisoprenyl-teichoic acid--peptidoglycan teichoic acid transferase [Solirubrobacterales bacterium]|jgi:LCP family protein required for cell wall assembly|nr:polyisoprenyl-teichoic acid--peptidoglycan teichoic acid transferase [Solirubrobacterales bacterium]
MTEPLLPGWSPKKPPPGGDSEKAPKPKRYWWRFALASVIIVAVSAGATATGVLLYVNSIAEALGHNNKLHHKLEKYISEVEPGAPENILILGSDKRAGVEFEEDPGRSDTTILLRLDPNKDTIAVMSIPRDLQVEIPGVGIEKFNAAYTYGGPKLTLQVVKELTGLKINHVVNVDFLGFVQAVYAIGCVFTDVDRRYYHSNEGVAASEQYAEINVQPGYQLLCGKKALEYVRYRHTDTDIVRSSRQQDFISSARQQISLKDLVFDQSGLIDIFTKYTTSDISDGKTMLEVLKLFIASRNAAIKEVHFPAELGPSFVTATPEAIEEAVDQFLGSEASGGPRGTLEGTEQEEEERSPKGGKGKKKNKGKKHKKKTEQVVKVEPPGSDGLVPAREAGELEAKTAVRRVHGRFPIFYPTRLPSGAFYVESNPYEKVIDPYVYRIKDGLDKNSNRYEAYRMVLVAELSDGTHYFGVQGIRGWSDPPILENPSLTKTINGREYDIYVDGDRVKLVAWHRGENSYWISNDLLETFTGDQMLGMARSADVIVAKNKNKAKKGTKE